MADAFYAGSFDPFTLGHLDVLEQALAWTDRVVVAIGTHSSKSGLLSYDARAALIERVVEDAGRSARISVQTFGNLTIDAARAARCSVILRGLRDGTDFDYEMQLAGMNARMAPDIRTVFVPASPETRFITATLVRQILQMGGDVKPFVPPLVERALNSHPTG